MMKDNVNMSNTAQSIECFDVFTPLPRINATARDDGSVAYAEFLLSTLASGACAITTELQFVRDRKQSSQGINFILI